jgi:glutamate synthase (NADPH/NADH) small chain
LKALGVTIETYFLMGHTATLEEFRQKFSAVLLATGAGIPKFLDIPGTSLGGVYYGEEFLMRVNRAKSTFFSRDVPQLPLGQKIAVIGSGNTALDCARTGVRLGCQVTLIFRRLDEDMRVAEEERRFAIEEGVQFASLVKPVEILSDSKNFVRGLKCVRMDFADKDGSGNWEVMELPGSEFTMDADTVIIAIGHNPNSLISKGTPSLTTNDDGTIQVREHNSMTSIPGVFCAGNVRTNAGPVVQAMASGKKAAEHIDNYLK